jgi:hypothetical protein
MAGLVYKSFANEPLFSSAGPSELDVIQGGVGDCYFLSTLASIARTDPTQIKDDITKLSNGTYDVRFFSKGKAIEENIDAELPVWANSGGLAYAQLGQGGSIWVALMEKAFAEFRNNGDNYATISSGWMTEVYTDLGFASSSIGINGGTNLATVYDTIANDLAHHESVTVATYSDVPYYVPLIGGHAYTVDSVSYIGGQWYLNLRNPWGTVGIAGYPSNNGYVSITWTEMSSLDGMVAAKV